MKLTFICLCGQITNLYVEKQELRKFFFKKAEIKPLTYPVLSRSTLVVDLVTLSNPVVLCFLSEKPLSPLVSYLRSIDLVWRTTWDITILFTVLYLIFRNFTKKKFKEKKIKVKIILNTQIPYSYQFLFYKNIIKHLRTCIRTDMYIFMIY